MNCSPYLNAGSHWHIFQGYHRMDVIPRCISREPCPIYYWIKSLEWYNNIAKNHTSTSPALLIYFRKILFTCNLCRLQPELSRSWFVPIIHGYVQIEDCPVLFDDDELDPIASSDNGLRSPNDINRLMFKLCMISRRSRYRAGQKISSSSCSDVMVSSLKWTVFSSISEIVSGSVYSVMKVCRRSCWWAGVWMEIWKQ